MPPKGVPMSDEQKAKIGAAHKGRVIPADVRARISATLTGRALSPETREKVRLANTGRKHSPESRAKRSATLMGHPVSPEARAKIGASSRGNRRFKDAPVLGECVYCFGPATTRDHVIPRGRPGWRDPDNVVLACAWCNNSKNNRTPEEWFAELTA